MPLAEWAAAHWWPLLEEGPPSKLPDASARHASPAQRGWFRRHNLLAAREGHPLPDLTIYRDDDDVVAVRCSPDEAAQGKAPVQFIERFSTGVAYEEVRSALRSLVEAVLVRLEDSDDSDAADLRARWHALHAVSPADRAVCARAAVLGLDALDPDDLDSELATMLGTALSGLPEPLVTELLALGPSASDLRLRTERLHQARSIPGISGTSSALSQARQVVLPVGYDPEDYKIGWGMARRFRQKVLGADENVLGPSLDRKIQQSALLISASADQREAGGLLGWVGADTENSAPYVLWGHFGPSTRRFRTARVLAMALLGSRERLVTDANSQPQRIGRAFAAELLAPAASVQARLRGPMVGSQEVDALAREFAVHPQLLRHQIENHRLAELGDD
jgi:hypothetical protein